MKKTYYLCVLALSVICVASCKKDNEPAEQGTGKDLVLTPLQQQKAAADNAFTFKLFKEASASNVTSKNLMLSPLSVSMALGMTSNGSSGQTLEAMRTALEFKGFTEEQINTYYQHLITELPELDPLAKVKIANSIWYRNNFTVASPFLQANTTHYKAAVEALDFSNPTAKDKINNWVNNQTEGKIPAIIDNIAADMVMYLINAVYFKSSWKYPFDKSKTTKGAFTLDNGNTVQADMMTANATMNIGNKADASIYELPYGNGRYSMVMILPKENNTLTSIISTLDTTKWKNWTSGLNQVTNDIKMPKFKFGYDIQLKNALSNLGMGIAFSDAANLTRINAAGGLFISEVKHKTFIEVNEEGTEAVAATSVGVGAVSVPQPVVINRPFLFAIREMKTGLILFTGVVNNPLLTE
jgi:serpin B